METCCSGSFLHNKFCVLCLLTKSRVSLFYAPPSPQSPPPHLCSSNIAVLIFGQIVWGSNERLAMQAWLARVSNESIMTFARRGPANVAERCAGGPSLTCCRPLGLRHLIRPPQLQYWPGACLRSMGRAAPLHPHHLIAP